MKPYSIPRSDVRTSILKINIFAAILLGLIILSYFTFIHSAITGAFVAEYQEYNNKVEITATSAEQIVKTHLVFDKYPPLNCRDSIIVLAGIDSVPFHTENEVYLNGVCTETDVIFDNVIYEAQTNESNQTNFNQTINETLTNNTLTNQTDQNVTNQSTITQNETLTNQTIQTNQSNQTNQTIDLGNQTDNPSANGTGTNATIDNSNAGNQSNENLNVTNTTNSTIINATNSTDSNTNSTDGVPITGGLVIKTITYRIYFDKRIEQVNQTATNNTETVVEINDSGDLAYIDELELLENSRINGTLKCIRSARQASHTFIADCSRNKVYFEDQLGLGEGVVYEIDNFRATWQLKEMKFTSEAKEDVVSVIHPDAPPKNKTKTKKSKKTNSAGLSSINTTTAEVNNSAGNFTDENITNNTANSVTNNITDNIINNQTDSNLTNQTVTNPITGAVTKQPKKPTEEVKNEASTELEIDASDDFELEPPTQYSVEDEDTLSYQEAFRGVDVSYTYSPDKLKEKITIGNKSIISQPDVAPETLDFVSLLDYDPTLKMLVNGEQYTGGEVTTPSRIKFMKGSDMVFFFTAPYAYDAAGNRIGANYKVEKKGLDIFLSVQVPYNWLMSEDRVYPVVIDPTMSSAVYHVSEVVALSGGRSDSSGGGYNSTVVLGEPAIGQSITGAYVADLGFFYTSFDVHSPTIGLPTFNVTQPSKYYKNIQVNASFVDSLGINTCSASVTGATTAGPYAMSIFNSTTDYKKGNASGVITDTLNDGSHTVTVTCTDSSGNSGSNAATFTTNTAPTSAAPILNSTDPTLNDTNQNLTAYKQSFADSDGDTLTAIYDWRINGTSIAILNMPFDSWNTTGVKDYSTFGNEGTITGATWMNSSQCLGGSNTTGGCYLFDGASDYITIADSASNSPLNEVTVSGWFYYNESGSNTGLIWKHSYNYALYTGESNAVKFIVWDSGATSSGTSFSESLLNIPGWNYITGVYNGTHSMIYLNGELKNTASTAASGIRDQAGDLYIGKRGDGVGQTYFNGSVDQIQIFNRSLSVDQIKAMYNARNPIYNLTVSNETNALENWTVAVTPNDGVKDGTTRSSNQVIIRDITPPTATVDNITSVERDVIVNVTEPAFVNETLEFNVTINDTESPTDSVWLVIWENAIGGAVKLKTFLSNILGNLWGTTVQTDDTFTRSNYNYSIFANDTSNNTVQFNDTFAFNHRPTSAKPILNSTDPTLNDSSQNLTAYNQSFSDADGDSLTAIYDWRINEKSIALLNMPFDTKNATGVKDYSTFGNGGSVINATWMNASQCLGGSNTTGGCYDFDGKLDYINVCDDNCIDVENRSFSVSVWAKPAFAYQRSVDGDFNVVARNLADSGVAYTGWKISFDKWLGWQFQVYNGTAYYANENIDAAAEWTHLVGVRNRTHIALYKNGNQVAASTIPYTVNVSSGNNKKIRIGDVGYYTEGGFFNGSIDQVQIFNRSLSANQIQAMYNAKAPVHNLITSDETVAGENWTVAVTPNDGHQDGITYISNNLSVQLTKSIAIGLSGNLSAGINWIVNDLTKTSDWNATGNNDSGNTLYYVSISTENTNADVYIKANRNLTKAGGGIIDLSNQKVTNSTTDQTITGIAKNVFTRNYVDNKIATAVTNGVNVFLKFFLNVPGGTGAGEYSNNVTIKAVGEGETP